MKWLRWNCSTGLKLHTVYYSTIGLEGTMVNVVVQINGGPRGIFTFSTVPRVGETVIIPNPTGTPLHLQVRQVVHEARDPQDGNPAGYSFILVG